MIEAPIFYYPDPSKCYIVYTYASDFAYGAQLSQKYNGQEQPVAFLSCILTDTQQKLSTTEQDAYCIYYAIPKWNYYLQGSDIIVHNDHKPQHKFLNGKNTNNKVNRWSLEIVIHNITFGWISGTHNNAADCLSQFVDVKDTPVPLTMSIYMLVTSTPDGPATCICSKTYTTSPTYIKTMSNTDIMNAPPPLMEDCKDPLHLVQKTDPFCKCISKWPLNGKVPSH